MLELINVSKIFKDKDRKKVKALDNITLRLPNEGFIFVIGKSGSGKSTLLNMIGGLDKTTKGRILVNDTKLSRSLLSKYRSNKIGFIFQHYYLIEHLTIKENIQLSFDISRSNKYSIEQLLDLVELKSYENRYPSELSGGQRQRVAIARALAKDPDIILADEPTGNLDKTTSTAIMEILKKISKEKLIVLVSHNLLESVTYADRIIELKDGKIINDKVKTNDNKDMFYKKGTTLYLPYFRDLTNEELDELLYLLKEDKINKIIQQNDGFVAYSDKKIKRNKEKLKLKKKNFSIKTTWKYIRKFLGKLKLNSMFIVATSALLILLISVISCLQEQSYKVTTYDNSLNYVKYIKGDFEYESNSSVFSCSSRQIFDEEFQEIEDLDYDGKVYKLYPMQLYSSGRQSNIANKLSTDVLQNCLKFYIQEPLGTLNCDESFLKENLTKSHAITFLAGDVAYNFDDIIITDYVADSLMFLYPNQYVNYNSIIGKFSNNYHTVNICGIIKTDYKEKYQSLIDLYNKCETELDYEILQDKLAKKDIYKEFLKDTLMYYGINYNLSDDFNKYFENRAKNIINHLILRKYGLTLNGKTVFSSGTSFSVGSSSDDTLIMGYGTYNSLFNKNLTANNYKEEKVDDINFMLSMGHKKDMFCYEKTYKLILTSSYGIYVSRNEFTKIYTAFNQPNAIYLENNGKLDIVHEKMKDRFYFGNIDSENIVAIDVMINMISPFFSLIKAVLYVILFVFVFLFGYNIIKKNYFDIGVMISQGVSNIDIAKIFISNIIINSLFICVVTTFVYPFLIRLSNLILIKSFGTMLNIKLYTITIISSKVSQLILNVFIILFLSVLSSIINIFRVALIKPINIINSNTKEL